MAHNSINLAGEVGSSFIFKNGWTFAYFPHGPNCQSVSIMPVGAVMGGYEIARAWHEMVDEDRYYRDHCSDVDMLKWALEVSAWPNAKITVDAMQATARAADKMMNAVKGKRK